MKNRNILGTSIILILLVTGCVQQQPQEQKSVTVDGVEYALSNDVSMGMAVPVYSPRQVREKIINSGRINVVFDCSTEDKPAITVAGYNSVSTIQNYLIYSKQKYALFKTFCFVGDKWYNSTNEEVAAPGIADATLLIRFSNETDVLFSYNSTIIIEGTDYGNLTLATDAFSLSVLGVKKE